MQTKRKIIEAIEVIASKARNSKLSDAYLKKVKPELEMVTDFSYCSDIQMVLFSIIFSQTLKSENVNLGTIAEHLGCEPLKLLSYDEDLKELEKLRYIRMRSSNHSPLRRRRGETDYYIPSNMVSLFVKGEKAGTVADKKLNVFELLEVVKKIFEEHSNEDISYEEMAEDIAQELGYNGNLPFVKKTMAFRLHEDEMLLFLYMCCQTVDDEKYVNLEYALNEIFDCTPQKISLKRLLVQGDSCLETNGLIELDEGNYRDARTLMLSDKALNILLDGETDLLVSKKEKNKNQVLPLDIVAKEMFYNPSEKKQIDTLAEMLVTENFSKLQERLVKNGMNKGVAILFHGAPGTGKTETVFQLAKNSGRSLIPVEVSQTKSMWFGESEKLIKEVFVKYKRTCKTTELTPILFFNEADGIISKRKEIGHSNLTQTENAIQNIILQEMETLEGIFIATTNLTQNLDKAFERRFLYKLKFEHPCLEAKIQIWKSKIPSLQDADAIKLASAYNFSGGQIDNVAKKYLMKKVLSGRKPQLKELEAFCKEEILETRVRIGF